MCYKPFIFSTVSSRIHKLIGRFSKDYPDCIDSGNEIKIRDIYFKALEKATVQQQDVSICGSFIVFDRNST